MGWKEQMSKTSARIKKSARDKTIGRAENFIDVQKERFKQSAVGGFIGAKGLKNKAAFVKNRTLNNLKKSKAYKNLQQMITKIQKIASFVSSNAYVIGIVSSIVLIIWNGTIFAISIVQSLGATPHYYCELDADKGIKNSGLYQQYCSKGSSNFELENINGHYFVQDGSGPCTCTASLNLLLRYYTRNDINFYDYVWDDSGQYNIDMIAQVADTEKAQGNVTVRQFTNGHTDGAAIDYVSAKNTSRYGSKKFALDRGKPGYDMANWGYVRDDSLDYSDVIIDESFTDFNQDSESWVWDLSIEENFGSGSAWGVAWSNRMISINGISATWSSHSGDWGNGDNLRQLLDEHPSGVIVYRNSASGVPHAILVTGYNEDVFYVVDSGLGLTGGFEGPCTSSLFCLTDIWDNEILNNPTGKGVMCYIYIEEDVP